MTLLAVLPDLPPEAYLPGFGALAAVVGILWRSHTKIMDRMVSKWVPLAERLLAALERIEGRL